MTATGVVGIAAVGILGYDVVWPLVYRALPGVRPVLDGALTVVAFVIPFVIGVVLLGPGRAEMVEGASVVVQVAVTIVMVVAFVIPFVIGVVLARSEPPPRAMLLTAVVGVVDSTLGWAISAWIGPGRAEMVDGASVVVQVAVTIVMVVAIYGVFGLAGAGVGRRWMRRPRARLSVR